MTAKVAGMVPQEFVHLIPGDADLMKIMGVVTDGDLVVVMVAVMVIVVMVTVVLVAIVVIVVVVMSRG
jgi:hypothetical protein